MPKRTRKSALGSSRAVLPILATLLALFAVGEGVLLTRSESGRIFAARNFGCGDPAHVTRLIGANVRRGLEAAHVPADSVREGAPGNADGRLRWRVGLAPEASLLQVNYAITKFLRDGGADVISARERMGSDGATHVAMTVGLPRRATHEIVLVRAPARPAGTTIPKARLALVLFGFGDDPKRASEFFELPYPFAVAVNPGADWSEAMFRAARDRDREVVLHLPLEPINFPQVNPGPGAILVTMKPVKIAGMVRRYLDDAGPVAAVANHMGSLATQDMEVMRAVYTELKRRRVPFLHVTPAAGAICKPLASDLGVEYDQPDLVIDGETRGTNTRALDRRWTEALEATRERGQLMVMLRATPLTREWLSKALARKRLGDIDLVPLGSLLRRPAAFSSSRRGNLPRGKPGRQRSTACYDLAACVSDRMSAPIDERRGPANG